MLSKSQPQIQSSALLEIMDAIEQGDFNSQRGTIRGGPAWAWAIEKGEIKAIEVAIDRSQAIGGHDTKGRSFLVAGLDDGLPIGMVLLGLSKSSDDWWKPGPDGRHAFSHPNLEVSMANAIGQRLWANGSWHKVHAHLGDWRGQTPDGRAMRMLSRWDPGGG